ncbi:MAG TPA: lasso peptide biosynthesis PqqD family chaperone [Thermobifida alba]|nr:lasso peptide biosynthesis PqqD family chaperone [Thermobifida alba]
METTGAEFRLRPDVSAAETDYGMVLLDGRSGEYWELNDTAAQIVQRLLDGQAPADVVRFLVGEYEVEQAAAERDVAALVTGLLESGMVLR